MEEKSKYIQYSILECCFFFFFNYPLMIRIVVFVFFSSFFIINLFLFFHLLLSISKEKAFLFIYSCHNWECVDYILHLFCINKRVPNIYNTVHHMGNIHILSLQVYCSVKYSWNYAEIYVHFYYFVTVSFFSPQINSHFSFVFLFF